MSLINQMLQDLDARRAAECAGAGLPNEVRPLPVQQRSRWPLLAAMGVLLVLVAGGAAWYALVLRDVSLTPSLASLPAPEATIVPVTVVPAAQPPRSPNLLPVAEGQPDLRMTTALNLPANWTPVPTSLAALERAPLTAAATGKPAAARPAAAASTVSGMPAGAPAAATSVASPPPSSGPMSIEKSVPSGSFGDRAEGEYRRAQNVLNEGRTSEALDALRAALKLNAAHIAARQLLLKLLVENKQLDDADGVLREGLSLHPAQIAWAMSLARLQLDRGDIAAAWKTLEHSLPAASGSSDYQGFAGHVLQRLGRAREAVDCYQAATRMAPAEGRWWLGLGLALEADGRSAPAREAYAVARASSTLSAELQAYVDQKLR